jgi:hypothetical protein
MAAIPGYPQVKASLQRQSSPTFTPFSVSVAFDSLAQAIAAVQLISDGCLFAPVKILIQLELESQGFREATP